MAATGARSLFQLPSYSLIPKRANSATLADPPDVWLRPGAHYAASDQPSPAESNWHPFSIKHGIGSSAALGMDVQMRLARVAGISHARERLARGDFFSGPDQNASLSEVRDSDADVDSSAADDDVVSGNVVPIHLSRRQVELIIDCRRDQSCARRVHHLVKDPISLQARRINAGRSSSQEIQFDNVESVALRP